MDVWICGRKMMKEDEKISEILIYYGHVCAQGRQKGSSEANVETPFRPSPAGV